MSLINCTECGAQVSDKALSCPKCACPINQSNSKKVTTIQMTGKDLKIQMILAVLTCIIFFIITIVTQSTLFAVLTAVGLLWIIITKIEIWWYHK